MRKFLSAILPFVAVVAFLFGSLLPASGEDLPAVAPVSPAFLQYMSFAQVLGLQNVTPDGYGLGLIPPPVDRSYLSGQSLFPVRPLVAIPSSYDLRAYGKVTPVKNQYSCGDCWAFATMGSLESNLLTAETWDFSENNLKNTHGFDWGACAGGNGDISTAYLARWGDANYQTGPVLEGDDPYNPNPPYTSPAGLSEQKHVQEVLILPGRSGPLDNDNIKQALMDYGAVFTSYYASGSYPTKSCPIGLCTTYYYSGSSNSNHAVAIVGWNDDFPASSFVPSAPGNGAFIIKNSWGTGWGENGGYFYISYYDSKLGRGENYVFNGAGPVTNYSRVYQYDPLGLVLGVGYGGTTGWFANIFTAAASEQVTAASFYTAALSSSYAIYVYTDATSGPRSGSLASTTTGGIAIPGYHTITLSSPVSIMSGHKFSVVVELETPAYTYPIPTEYPYPGYSSKATASAGQSYISANGTNWSDITSLPGFANTNVCLKAFTVAGDTTAPVAPIGLSAAPAVWTNINSFSINWTNPADPSGIAGAYFKLGSPPTSDSDGAYTTSKPFNVIAASQGGQSIYVWLEDGEGNKSYVNSNSATLYYDGTLPVNGTISASPEIGQISLNWSGFSDSGGSGLSTFKIMRNTGSSPSAQCSTGMQVYLGSGNSLTDTGLAASTTYYYRACAYDNAGNVSAGATASAYLTSCSDQPVKNARSGATYSFVQVAYGNEDTQSGDTLWLLATTLTEAGVTFSRNISITLSGGHECGFGGRTGFSTISTEQVPLTVRYGSVTFDQIVIK